MKELLSYKAGEEIETGHRFFFYFIGGRKGKKKKSWLTN